MSEIFRKEGVVGQWLGQEFVKVAARASAAGATAVANGIQRRASLGIKHAQNQVEEKTTQGITRKGVTLPKGIKYFVGKGAPLGGYPGMRTGTLERTIAFESARPDRRPRAFATASAEYAAAVHSYESGEPKRPFLTLPLTYSQRFLHGEFEKAFTKTFTAAGIKGAG